MSKRFLIALAGAMLLGALIGALGGVPLWGAAIICFLYVLLITPWVNLK